MIDALQLTALAAPAISLAGGFALGALFGRKLVADLVAMVQALDSRLSSVESTLSGAGAAAIAHPAAAQAQHTAALEHHAQATEKLAGAIAASAALSKPAAK
jgi:glutamate-1-semialdehyde aminotransferase